MIDLYTLYEIGVQVLLTRLGDKHPEYNTAQIYRQRLAENLEAVRTYGDSRDRESARAEILDRLQTLTQETLGVDFVTLCPGQPAGSARPAPDAAPVYNINTGGGAVVMGDVAVSGGDFVGRDAATVSALRAERDEMPGTAASVDTAALRVALRRFDDVQLDALCLDHFPDVYEQFGRGQRRDEKITQLLAYVRPRPAEAARLARLLEELV